MAIIGIAASMITTMGDQKRKISRQLSISISASLVKQKLVGIVLSPQSWQITQANNSAAFVGGGANKTYAPALNLYTPDSSTAFYASTNAQAGFDLNAMPCLQFSTRGNDACPLRYDITLKNHAFLNGNWVDTLHFALSYKPSSSGYVLNTLNPQFTFDLVRNLNDQSVESTCISVNGLYDANTSSCSIKLTTPVSNCANTQTYRGPSSNGQASNCDNKIIPATTCAAGQVINGFDAFGNPVCQVPI